MNKKERPKTRKVIEKILRDNPRGANPKLLSEGYFTADATGRKVNCSQGIKIQARKMVEEEEV